MLLLQISNVSDLMKHEKNSSIYFAGIIDVTEYEALCCLQMSDHLQIYFFIQTTTEDCLYLHLHPINSYLM